MQLADELESEANLGQHIFMGQICGSIRRQKDVVKDIDWVMIQKDESEYEFGDESLDQTIIKLHKGPEPPKLGKKFKSFMYYGIQVELYLADEKTFETLVLIRTGSKEHNIKLTMLARNKQLKLFASGKGLCKVKGGIYNNEPEEIMEVVENTENGILVNLLGKYVMPEKRF